MVALTPPARYFFCITPFRERLLLGERAVARVCLARTTKSYLQGLYIIRDLFVEVFGFDVLIS